MGDKIDILREELRTLLQAAIFEAYPAVIRLYQDGPALSDIVIHLSASSEEHLSHAQENYGVESILEKLLEEIVANSAIEEDLVAIERKLVECGGRTWIGLGIYNPEQIIAVHDQRFLRSLRISSL